jgi:hypothetical protein
MVLIVRIAVLMMLVNGLLTAADVKAVKLDQPIVVDGKLNEAFWSKPAAVTEFKQKDPDQGGVPSERTEVWVAYDDEAIYIAARMHDSSPDSIMAFLDRRDNLNNADWFGVFLDPYRDKRSGNYFVVGPAGTVADGVLYNDDWDDSDWDGVWEGRSSIDDKGWSVEMRIPFSQLRFQEKEPQVWGINFRRDIGRRNEQNYLVYTPRMESGYVSRFPELTGLEGIKPANALEILPFVTAKHERIPWKQGNPFDPDGIENIFDAGADIKYGISSNLILDATINPDFGQVEVDPATVNLTDVESFFQEKRPFFIEGASTFSNFGRGGGRNYWNFNFPQPTFFYSRRIGRSPSWNDTLSADYVDAPIATRILGAGKITGKLGDGWNVGTIHALTAREHTQYQFGGVKGEAEIEPQTYYGVGRVQKEMNDGRQGLGILSTWTVRDFDDRSFTNRLNSSSLFAGVDGWTFLDEEKAWVITGYAGLSHVEGSAERMIRLQRNSTHYFQRPDASHLTVDSSATSLTGYSARVYLMKQKGNFFLNSSFGLLDPKFEVNDLGFLSRTDVVNMHVGAGYNWTEPDGTFRRKEIGGAFALNYDYEGNLTNSVLFNFGFIQLMNYYSLNWNLSMNPAEAYNTRRTRGGPLTINAKSYGYNLNFSSDYSKPVVVEYSLGHEESAQYNSSWHNLWAQFRPVSNVTLSVGPGYGHDDLQLQWIGMVYDDATAVQTFGRRYVFAALDYHELSANIRLNWTFTPQLSLQLYVQPLIATESYSKYKVLARAGTKDFTDFGSAGTSLRDTLTNGVLSGRFIDADGPIGTSPEQFVPNSNQTRKELRGNAILRWEYLPGSTLYFVWTQSRSAYEEGGEFNFSRSFGKIGDSQPDNIFAIKMSYYFNM